MPELVLAEEHGQIYRLWRERGLAGLRLAHVDHHCDMRGLLIDRRRGRAWLIDRADPRIRVVDSGNFLAHAIVEGVVTGVTWVHDRRGGRRYDIGTVKYESDPTAWPHRLLHRLRPAPEATLAYREVTFEAWAGPAPGEHLDIDWDGLASVDYPPERIARLCRDLLELPFPAVPETTYLVYSPGYSHPDRTLYEGFAERLGEKIGARVVRLEAPPEPAGKPAPRRWAEAAERALVLGLRRIGIY
jgi:hypothetical protein